MSPIEETVEALFQHKGMWRDDGHLLVLKLTDKFHESFKELSKPKGRGAPDSGYVCAALVKLHWALCSMTGQASTERLDDANRFLEIIAAADPDVSTNLFDLSRAEQSVLEGLPAKFSQGMAEDPPLAPFGPLVGSLAQVSQLGSRPRRANALGISKLKETSDRSVMDHYLAAHRHFSSRFRPARS